MIAPDPAPAPIEEESRRTTVSMEVNTFGELTIRERTGEDEKGHWVTDTLIDNEEEWDNVELQVAVREDGKNGVCLTMSSYHVKSEANGRVFHCNFDAMLEIEDIKHLHAFLGFLLASGLDGVSND